MNVAVHVSQEVAAAWPDYRAVVVIAEAVVNGPSDEQSERLLAEAERAARGLGLERAADDPRIAAWRRVFSEFGAKPSRYPSSAESLLAQEADARRAGKVLCLCRERRGDPNREDCQYLYPERL